MTVSKFEKFLPLAGVLTGALMLVTWIPTGPDSPDDPTLTAYLAHHQTPLVISAIAAALACVTILFFVSGVRAALRTRESGEASYSSVAYAGGILAALSGATTAMAQFGSIDAAHHGHADIVRTIAYLTEFSWLPWVAATSVLMLGTGIGGLRLSATPKWHAILTIVLGAMCLLGPTGIAVFFAQPFWYAITGVLLYRRLTAAPVAHGAPSGLVATGV